MSSGGKFWAFRSLRNHWRFRLQEISLESAWEAFAAQESHCSCHVSVTYQLDRLLSGFELWAKDCVIKLEVVHRLSAEPLGLLLYPCLDSLSSVEHSEIEVHRLEFRKITRSLAQTGVLFSGIRKNHLYSTYTAKQDLWMIIRAIAFC